MQNQKTSEVTTDSINNKTAKDTQNSQQNNTEIVTNEHDEKITEERYITPKEWQKIIHNLGLNIKV